MTYYLSKHLLFGLSPSSLQGIYFGAWWGHLVAILVFANYLPFAKHFHVITALPNLYFAKLDSAGKMATFDIEKAAEAERFGVSKIEDFTWKQKLDFMTCTECGRCREICPTHLTGKPLSPKTLTVDLRNTLYAEADDLIDVDSGRGDGAAAARLAERKPLIGGWISEDTIWACTTCRYCEHACPVGITYVDKITDMRRHLVLEKSEFPKEAQTSFNGMERQGNPWNLPAADRGAWAKDLPFPVLTMAEAARSRRRRGPVLGRLRRLVRGARQEGVAGARAPPPRGRRHVRDPRERGDVHGRRGAPARQRVPLPDARAAEHRDDERLRGQEDRHELPALLQHARERVPGLRREVRGRPRDRARREARRRGPREAHGEDRAVHLVPRPVLPRPPQRRLRGAARHPERDPGPHGEGAAAQPRRRNVLRRGRRPHVAGRDARDAHQPGALRGDPGERDGRRRRLLPVLHGHARKRENRNRRDDRRVRRPRTGRAGPPGAPGERPKRRKLRLNVPDDRKPKRARRRVPA